MMLVEILRSTRRLILVMAAFALGGPAHAAPPPPKLLEPQLEQLVAPIALHPDALLSHILMVATYPLEVMEAGRWSRQNSGLTGEEIRAAMTKQPWDESVRSLTAFPQVLQMMNDRLSWTQQLGDAFLAQPEDVLDAVQRLRARADAQRSLATTKEQIVEAQVAPAPDGSGTTATTYVIEPTDPAVIYVPAYDPVTVYGPWPYAEYPPYSWYPPGYASAGGMWFAAGIVAGDALWGFCDWRHRTVNIEVTRYNRFNQFNPINGVTRFARWEHNEVHRRGVSYRDPDVAARYGRDRRNVVAREQFRGYVRAGRRDLVDLRPGGADHRPDLTPGTAGHPVPERRQYTADRHRAIILQQTRMPVRDIPYALTFHHQTAFDGMEHGHRVRQFSARGANSRGGGSVDREGRRL